MNAPTRIFLFALASLLSSCATKKVGEHSYYKGKCTDCYNNPITGSPLNYRKGEESIGAPSAATANPSATIGSLPATTSCGKKVTFEIAGKVDVDTTYARIKRQFGYKTRDEVLRERGINPGSDLARRNQWFDSGYRHELQPGVRYLLSEKVTQKVGSSQERAWLTLDINKDGNGSRIYGEYCDGGTDGFSDGGALLGELKSEIDSLLAR